MEIWKGLRGKTEGQNEDKIMKNFIPHAQEFGFELRAMKSPKVLNSRILTLKGNFRVQYVKQILEGSQKEQSRDCWMI